VQALVIDDSKSIRLILGHILKDIGFHVLEAPNGHEGLSMLKARNVDLILVDWNMPEMNGFEFILKVRQESQFNDVRLMMVTTETEITKVVQALEAGANEYVMKPFTKETILEKISLMGMEIN